MLCDKYRLTLGRDPSYQEYLDKIAQIFFGVRPPPNSRPRGLFGISLKLGTESDTLSDTNVF